MDKLEELTWDDLEAWAGDRVVKRGRSYRKAVHDLRRVGDQQLVAWVHGGERYATLAGLGHEGELIYECTCPYDWGPCKHSVAVILRYLEAVKDKTEIPDADTDDKRLMMLESEDEEDEDEWEDGEDWEDGPYDEFSPTFSRRTRRLLKKQEAQLASDRETIRKHLSGFSKEALVELVLEFAECDKEMQRTLLDRALLNSGKFAPMVESIRREITALSPDDPYSDDLGNILSRVGTQLESLLESGQADDVVSLGKNLVETAFPAIGAIDDEGETSWCLSDCMKTVFEALPQSSLSQADQLLWEIDASLSDDYGVLDGIDGPLTSKRIRKGEWAIVADRLGEQLEKIPVPPNLGEGGTFHDKYTRERMMRWVVQALGNAGREEEIVPLLEREVQITGCYEALVGELIEVGRIEDARRRAVEGFEKTLEKWPGIAWSLEAMLRDLAVKEKDSPLVAALRAAEFFNRPSVTAFDELRKATEVIDLWPAVRAAVLYYLETGTRPDVESKDTSTKPKRRAGKGRKAKAAPKKAKSEKPKWPLPPTGLKTPTREGAWVNFPNTDVLIEIAIHEKRLDDVVRWYDLATESGQFWGDRHGHNVAEAVQKSHPDVALKIWRDAAEKQISMVQPAAYQVAGTHLQKMEAVYRREKRLPEWEAYLARLREENKRRPRMIEVLDRIEGKRRNKRIIDS